MEFVLYDHKSSVTFPDMSAWTPEDLENSNEYKDFMSKSQEGAYNDVVLQVANGIVYYYEFLGNMKARYNVLEEDPETALEAVKEAIRKEEEAAKQEKLTLSDMQDQLNALTSAFDNGGVSVE